MLTEEAMKYSSVTVQFLYNSVCNNFKRKHWAKHRAILVCYFLKVAFMIIVAHRQRVIKNNSD